MEQWFMTNNSMVVFVNNDSVAANYPVAPGYTVALINANDPTKSKLFLKSTEANGMPNPMRVFELKDVTPVQSNGDTVSRKEFDALNDKLAKLMAMLEKGESK